MDFLGKEGEKAADAVENLSQRVEDLESHLNAVDSAVQETRQESREMDLEVAEENRERLVQLEKLMKQMMDVQKHTLMDVESEKSRESRHEAELGDRLNSLQKKLKRTRETQKNLESHLERVERKVFSVEEELTNEIELNQDRIESRPSEDEFRDLKRKVSQLKTSVNALADDMDDNSITVE